MKVFVTGATGYVGNAVAAAFSRAGHDVYGLTRREKSLPRLASQEIRPVHGDLHSPDTFREPLQECSLIVHCAMDDRNAPYHFEFELMKIFSNEIVGSGAQKRLLFTSSTWVHGDTGDEIVSERFSPSPPSYLKMRAATERMVLESNSLAGTVIRPGCVYGGHGGPTAQWFAGALMDEVVTVVGDGRNVWATVHREDLADAYLRIAEHGYTSEVFDIVDAGRDRVGVLADSVGRVMNVRFPTRFLSVGQAVREYGDSAYGMNLSQRIDSSKARKYLGWTPRHRGFGDKLGVYIAAWRAVQQREIKYEEVDL